MTDPKHRLEAIRLHVNIDHVATVRNARGTPYPDPVAAALQCIEAGADGITAHLREDRRHIRDSDVDRLRETVRTTFNLEMAATTEMVAIATRVLPDLVTLVPERREERTTEGGLDVVRGGTALETLVRELRDAKIRVSMFIAADEDQIKASRAMGAEMVELHTGDYAHAWMKGGASDAAESLEKLVQGARIASESGLAVAAGHGLTCENVSAIARVSQIVELNIGHALISDALFHSLPGAVRRMRAAMNVR